MALTLNNRAAGTGNKTSEASTTATAGAAFNAAVGDLIVAYCVCDNSGTGGISPFSSMSDNSSGKISWGTALQKTQSSGGAANDGLTVIIAIGTVTSSWTSVTLTTTFNWSPNTTAKGFGFFTIVGGASGTALQRTDYSSDASSGFGPVNLANPPANGNVIVAVGGKESNTAFSTDAFNAVWTTGASSQISSVPTSGGSGGDATKMSAIMQAAVENGTAGACTWSPTETVVTSAAGIFIELGPATVAVSDVIIPPPRARFRAQIVR